MTVETKLRTAMAEAVAPEIPDTEHLVSSARRQGLGIRRRRQALAGVGVAATLGLAVVAPNLVAGANGGRSGGLQVATAPASFDSQDTRPLTGRSAAAALFYAVGLTAAGEGTDFRGAADDGPAGAGAYTIFRFTPSGSTAAGEVAVNIDPPFIDDNDAKPGDTSPEHPGACQSFMTDCVTTRLADGSRLTTYDDLSSHGSGIRRVAELLRPIGVRVLASASNGSDVTELDEQITRAEPVLTTDQLVDVVTQPWWGLRLPAYFTTLGDKLTPYSDRSSSAMATPSAAPTPSK
jgi:hypothetical protein